MPRGKRRGWVEQDGDRGPGSLESFVVGRRREGTRKPEVSSHASDAITDLATGVQYSDRGLSTRSSCRGGAGIHRWCRRKPLTDNHNGRLDDNRKIPDFLGPDLHPVRPNHDVSPSAWPSWLSFTPATTRLNGDRGARPPTFKGDSRKTSKKTQAPHTRGSPAPRAPHQRRVGAAERRYHTVSCPFSARYFSSWW